MKYQLEPMSYDAAIDFLSDKTAVGSGMDSSQWANVPAAIRQRALFSATLENARIAQEMQDYLTDFIAGFKEQNEQGEEFFSAQGRAEFVTKFREMIQDAGIGKTLPDGSIDPFINDDDLRDLRSARRLQLIFDTNIDAAYSYAGWLESQDPDILSIYPCWRFIRVRPVKAPRDYHDAAIDKVARKDDLQFWLSLNRDFNLPYGPWGFNSGCDIEEIDIEEAEQLGVMKRGDKPPKPIIKDFNDQLSADIKNLSPAHKNWLINNLNGYALIEANTLRALKNPTPYNNDPKSTKSTPYSSLPQSKNRQDGTKSSNQRGINEDEQSQQSLQHRIWDARGARAAFEKDWQITPDSEKYVKDILDIYQAQLKAVDSGRKALYIEPLPKSVFDHIQKNLPPHLGALWIADHVTVYHKQAASLILNCSEAQLVQKITQSVESGESGDLLGYGLSSFFNRPATKVTYFNNGIEIFGFFSSPDLKIADHFAQSRMKDFEDALGWTQLTYELTPVK